MEVDIESLVTGLPDSLNRDCVVICFWNQLQTCFKLNGADVISELNGPSDNIQGTRDRRSLLFHFAEIKGMEVSHVLGATTEQLHFLEKSLAHLECLYLPIIFVLFARLFFYSRHRRDGEKVEDYFQVLENLSEICEFGLDREYIVKQHFMKGGEISTSLKCLIQESSPLSLRQIFNAFLILKDQGVSKMVVCDARISPTDHRDTHSCHLETVIERENVNLLTHKVQKLMNVSNALNKKSKTLLENTKRFDGLSESKPFQTVGNRKELTKSNILFSKQPKLLSGKFKNSKDLNCIDSVNVSSSTSQQFRKCAMVRGDEKGNSEVSMKEVAQMSHSKSSQDQSNRLVMIKPGLLDVGNGNSVHEGGNKNLSAPCLESPPLLFGSRLETDGNAKSLFTCYTCKLMFAKLDKYKDHIKVHICQCEICGTKFAYPSLLDRHMSKHTGVRHYGQKIVGAKVKHVRKKFYCSVCHLTFSSGLRFRNHMVKFCETCRDDCTTHNCSHEKTVKCPGQKKHRRHHCNLCGVTFQGIYELYQHNTIHTQEQHRIALDGYGNAESSMHHFHRQISCHHSKQQIPSSKKTHDCTICGEKFTKKFYLKNHIKVHSGQTPYTCEICGTCFKSQWNLSRHYFVHTGAKSHLCSVCNKSFKWQSTLMAHMKSHHDSPVTSQQPQPIKQMQDSHVTSFHAAMSMQPPSFPQAQTNELLKMKSAENLQAGSSHQPQLQQLQERHHHSEHQKLPAASQSHSDQGKMTGHPHTGVWSPFVSSIPTQRQDWVYWTEWPT